MLLTHGTAERKRKGRSREGTHMPQHSEDPAALSPYRAFVVQFRTETDLERGCCTGRVEHVVSGQATHFASLEELLAFMARVLATVRAPPPRRRRSR